MTASRARRTCALAAVALLLPCAGSAHAQEKPSSHTNPPAITPETPSPFAEEESLYLPKEVEYGPVWAVGEDGVHLDALGIRVALSRIGLGLQESTLFAIPRRTRVTSTRIDMHVDCSRLKKGQLGSTLIENQENQRVTKRCGTNRPFVVAWAGLPVYTDDVLEFYSRAVATFANWEVVDPVSLTIDGSRITLRFNSGAQRISIIRQKVIRCRRHGRTDRCVTYKGHFSPENENPTAGKRQ